MAELPDTTIPPPEGDDEAASDSLIAIQRRDWVAVIIDDAPLRQTVERMLTAAGRATGGPTALDASSVVIAQTTTDISETVARIRREARADAAILMIVDPQSPSAVAEAHDAGAFACVRMPIVAEELVGLVTSATEAQSAKFQVLDLSRRLDLEAHLASIGRIGAGLSHEVSSPLMAAKLSLASLREVLAEQRAAVELLRGVAFASVVDRDKRVLAARTFLERAGGHAPPPSLGCPGARSG